MRFGALNHLAATAAFSICLTSSVLAVTVSSIGTLPLSNGAYTGVNEDSTPATYTKPANLVLDALTNNNPMSTGHPGSSRAVRTGRDNGQTFTIDASEYPEGLEVAAFAMQFEKRGNGASPSDTFDVKLFRLVDFGANQGGLLPNPDPEDVIVTGTSLTFPTATSLGVDEPSVENNGATGTAIFHFSESLVLQPGEYAFQFFPSWPSQTGIASFDWARPASNAPIGYAGGRGYETDAANTSDTDFAFGLIGVVENLEGDFNNDGIVNLADYTVWRDNLGGDSAVLNGNGTGNPIVGSEDYDLWKANFGTESGGVTTIVATHVPEPRAALLLGGVVAGFAVLRRRSLSL